jgi:flagellar biogenesis protein FliO
VTNPRKPGGIENMQAESSGAAPQQSRTAGSWVIAFFSRLCSTVSVRRSERKLRLCETLSFGEKRFIAVVEYDHSKFLVAGTPKCISLLQRLDGNLEKTGNLPEVDSEITRASQT